MSAHPKEPCHPTDPIFTALEITSEEITAKRRDERRQFKIARAQAMAAAAAEAEAAFAEGREAPSIIGADGTRSIPSAATWKPEPKTSVAIQDSLDVPLEYDEEDPLEDVEHLQLTLPEAFFLLWNLDCLTVLDPHTVSTTALCCAVISKRITVE